jgi:hypothetical protein
MHLWAFLRYSSFLSSSKSHHSLCPSFKLWKAFSFAFSWRKILKAPDGGFGFIPLL